MATLPAPSAAEFVPPPNVALCSKVPLYPAEQELKPTTVCVTGATGFAAGAVIERLLRSGHTVHATCRDPNKMVGSPLTKLPGAEARLSFFAADLTKPGSFDAAISGCTYVIHTAAPVILNNLKKGEGRTMVVEPMVQGVENVLGAVNRTPSVKRVVMTSSISALCNGSGRDKPGGFFDETDYNTQATEEFYPYACGKARAEKRAWEIAGAQSRWDLVTILPVIILGPTPDVCASSESVEFMVDLMKGLQYPVAGDLGGGFIDTRDVAASHCLAMAHPKAHGRYIICGRSASLNDLTHIAAKVWPGFKAALAVAPAWLVWLLAPYLHLNRDVVWAMRGPPPVFDCTRICWELGLKYTPTIDTVRDMLVDMVGKALIKAPKGN